MALDPALNNKKKKNRPEEVLDAARELFFKQGYRGTSIIQIAQRAGYSKRTVYLDYQHKDELFMTVCEEGGRLLLEKLKSIPFDDLTIDEAVNRFMKVYIAFSRDHREYFRMIFSESSPEIIANCSDELRTKLGDLERACLNVLVAWGERAMGYAVTFYVIMAVLQSSVGVWVASGKTNGWREVLKLPLLYAAVPIVARASQRRTKVPLGASDAHDLGLLVHRDALVAFHALDEVAQQLMRVVSFGRVVQIAHVAA